MISLDEYRRRKDKKEEEAESRIAVPSLNEVRKIQNEYGSMRDYHQAKADARVKYDTLYSLAKDTARASMAGPEKYYGAASVAPDIEERTTSFNKRRDDLIKDLREHPGLDNGGVYTKAIGEVSGVYPDALRTAKAMDEYWSRFKNEDDYKDAFKRWSIGWDESRAGDESFEDTEETRKARQEYYEGLKKRRAELQAEKNTALVDYPDSNTSNVYGSEEWQNREDILADANKNNDEIEALDAEITRYERFMEVQDKYAKLREDPNFERYAEIEATHSGYGADENGNTISTGNNVVDNYFGVSEKYKDVNISDPTFDAMYGVSDQERNLIEFGYDYSLDELTEEEKQTYRYLLSTQGTDSADQFLEDMKPTLNRRAVQREANELKNASGWELAFRNIASVPQNVLGGVTAFVADVIQGDNKNPYDKWHRDAISASAVRGETAERMGNVGGFIYQSLMSAADSVAGAALMGRAYTLTMGAGASANRTRELYEKGASNYQILTSAFLSGLTEVVTEYVSVDKFLKDFLEAKPKNALDLVKKIFMQGGVEASEEFAAEVLNAIQDEEIMGSQSEMNLEIKEQMDRGVSREEAQRRVLTNHFVEAVKAAAGGFISGVAMGGGAGVLNSVGNAIDTRREGRYVNENNGAEALQNLAREVAGAPNLTKAVDKVTKKASNKNVGKLSRALEQTIVNEADADTRAEKGAKYTLAREGIDLSDVKAREGTNFYNNVDVSEKISDTGTTVETETGGEITIDEKNPITQRDGKTYLNTSAGEILQDDIKYSSEKEAQLYEYVSDLPQSVANAIVENYKGQDNVRGYVNGMRDGILLYGYNNIENAPKNTAFATLSKADQQYALKAGRLLAAEDLNNAKPQTVGNHVAVKETATTSGERVMNLSEIGLKATPAVAKKIGAGGTAGAVYTKGDVDLNSAMGRADGLLAYVYSSIAGNSVVLYDSKTVKDADLKNANGKHVASDGTIYLDIRAEAGNNVTGGIAYTLGHEMTHEAEQWAKKEYAAFKKFLYENYIEKGTVVEDLIAKKMSDLDTTDRAYAESEVVADACERMLLDSDAMEKLAELRDKDPGTFKKIVDFIKRTLEKIVGKFNSIREVYETMGAENTRIESKLVQEFGDNLKKLQDMWSDMVVKAAQNRAAAVETKQNVESTGTQYQKKSAAEKYADFDKPITQADVDLLRSIGRKSINDFTSEDLEKAAKWAYKFYQELGTKSPFFRAWFGDWRASQNDENVELVKEETGADYKAGKETNGDTGKTISWGHTLKAETITNATKAKKSISALRNIRDIVKNAILLDTSVVKYDSNSKMPGSAFMHSFYTLYDDGNQINLLKLYVEEALSSKNAEAFTRAYELKDIEKVADFTNSVLLEKEGLTDVKSTTDYSIADLYALVKQYDKDFTAGREVNPALLNEDGTPRVFYHGTLTKGITEFNKKYIGSRFSFDEVGFFFIDKESIADDYARSEFDASKYGEIIPTYLNIQNPFIFDKKYALANGYGNPFRNDDSIGIWDAYQGALLDEIEGSDYDGIIIDDGMTKMAVAFEPTQIKSATNNIGTFDAEEGDIRYSLKQNRVRTPAEIRKEMSDLAAEIATLQKQYEQIENSDEYKTLYGAVIDRNLNDEQFNEALEKYSEWEKESGFAELHRKLGDLRKRSGELNREFSEALRNADVLEEQENIKKSGLTDSEYFRKQAVKEFGYTPYFIDAGYLLPDGKLLNFSGEKGRHFGTRGQDHRAIGTIFADSTGSSAMLRFMKDGNIRVMAEGPGVDISSVSEPTQEQYSAISRFIQDSKEKGYFSVDFTDENGTVVGKLEYEDSVAPSRVINDIKHFYQTGETREQSTVSRFHGDDFSRKSSESYAVRDIVNRALKRLDPSSAEYRAVAKYKTELDKLDNMRAQLDEAIKNNDRQAQTRLTNNIKTQRGILNRIENSASMKNVASMRDVTRLADDAKKLREMLKLQGRETNGTIAKQRSVNAAASEIMEKYGIKRGKGELNELLSNYYTKMMQSVNNETMTREAALDQAREVAEWIARHVPDEVQYDDGAIEALDMLRGYKVKLNDDQRQNIRAKYDNISGWRRAVGGYITLSNEGKYLDELWPEWAERAPGYFTNEMISDADMPERLAEIIDSLKKSRETVIEVPGQYEYDLDRAANDVYEAFWNIEPEQTVADKYAERIKTLKAEHNAMMSDLRKSFRDTIREETREAYREGKQKAREYTRKIEVRRKVKKLADRLATTYRNPKANKYVPKALQAPALELLSELNFETGRRSKLADAFGALKLQYDAMAKDETTRAAYPAAVSELIEKMRTEVKGMAVKDMTADQLEDIYTTLKAFDHVLKNAREARLLSSSIGEDMTVYQVGEKWIKEIMASKEAKSLINKYTQQMLSPREFFQRLASYAKDSTSGKIFDMLNRAERRQAQIEMESNMIFNDILQDRKYIEDLSSTKEKNLVDIGLKDSEGKPFLVTRGMMLAYYMHTLNEDNARHVAIGGLTAPDIKQYYKSKADSYSNGKRIPGLVGPELAAQYEKIHDTLEGARNEDGTRSGGLNEEIQDAMDRNDSERVNELISQRDALWAERDEIIARGMRMIDEQRKNIEGMLSEKDKAFVKAAQDYFGNYSKNVLNEATMQMYGFEKARVENYFPIHSDPNFLKAAFETVTNDASLENKGFMKDRVKSANPILLEDFASVINSQIEKTAQYAAFAPTLQEFNKIYSVKTGGVASESSVQGAVNKKFGKAGSDYISNLVADMNGARRRDTTFLDRARSNFAGAVLTLNPRVSMVQAASYPTAAAVVGHKALAKALVLPDNSVVFKRANQELIAKYTARLWQRNQGGADVTLHDAKSVNSLYSRANRRLRFLTGWIEAVDAGTVGRLWYASEYYVREHFKNLERGTDEYYEKTAEIFDEVVERTQPNYTTLQRPDILRNPNQLVRSLTMFMTQRLQNFNIVYSAARRYAKYSSDLKQNKNDVTREDVREARGNLTRAITSQAVATAALAGIKLLADALLHNFRRRKDEETGDITAESVLMSTVDDFIGSLFSDIVGGSEAYDIVKSIVTGGKYYEPEIGGIGTFVDTAKNAVNLSQKIMGKYNPSANDFIKLGYNLAQIFGIPAENGGKIGKALWNHVQDIKNGEFGSFNAGDAKTEKQKGVAAYRAYERGDMDTYEEISSTMKNPKDAMKYGTGSSYGKFDEAVETGEDLGGVIDEYLDMGYTEENLAAQITRDFKQKYRNASDKASLKRKLLDAYEELGYDRDKKSKDIDKWLED